MDAGLYKSRYRKILFPERNYSIDTIKFLR
jgi:hypothetical protein